MIDPIMAEIIAKKYYKDVYSYCFSYLNCNEAEAADVTQDVFLVFQEKCDTLENSNIRGWLYAVARNKLKEHFRRMKKDDMLLSLDDDVIYKYEDEMPVIFDEYFKAEDEEIEKYKDIILNSLTKNEQELYTKIFLEKKKYKEIAEELNTTEKSINSKAMRLRIKIRRMVTFTFTSVGQFIIKLFF